MASGWGAVLTVTSADAGMGAAPLGVLPATAGGSAASEAAIGPASMVLFHDCARSGFGQSGGPRGVRRILFVGLAGSVIDTAGVGAIFGRWPAWAGLHLSLGS